MSAATPPAATMSAADGAEEEDAPAFAKGAVRRLVMRDFMTYESAVLDAGPRLNLVIAKNGAGKSTTLLALALALGGQPKLLGRAANIAGFIRHGQSKARVEVTLHDPDLGDPTVVREIVRIEPGSAAARRNGDARGHNDGDDDDSEGDDEEGDDEDHGGRKRSSRKQPGPKTTRRATKQRVSAVSNWWLNGKPSSERKVQKFLKERYNTQVSNLCQVLPQDKVAMFSRLDEAQLLTETIRAGLGQAWVDEQDEIIKEQIALSQAFVSVQSAEEELEQKQGEMEALRERVKRLEERKAALDKIELCGRRLLHLSIVDLKKESNALKNELDALTLKTKEVKARLAQAKASLAEQESQIRADRPPHGAKQDLDRAKVAVPSCRQKIAGAGDKVDGILDRIRDERQAAREHKKRLAQARLQLNEVQGALAAWAADNNKEDLMDRLRAANERANEVAAALRRASREIAQIDEGIRDKGDEERRLLASREKLRARLSSKEAVLDKLRNSTIKNAWNVVKARQEQGGSKGDTFVPIMELKAKSPVAAGFLERVAGMGKLTTMVTDSSPEARECLFKLRGVDVLVVHEVVEPRRRLSPEDLARFGLDGYLDDLIEGPPVVIQALRDIASIHNCVVGSDEAAKAFLALPESERMQLFEGVQVQTPRTAFTVRRSKHGARNSIISTREFSRGLLPARFIGGSEDDETKRRLEEAVESLARVRRELADLNETRASLVAERDQTREDSRRLDSERKSVTELLEFERAQNVRAAALKDKVATLERSAREVEAGDAPSVLKARLEEGCAALAQSVSAMTSMAQKIQIALPALNTVGLYQVRQAKYRLGIASFELRVHAAQTDLQRTENKQTAIRQRRDENRAARRNLLQELGDLSSEEEEAIAELPDVREEVAALRNVLRAKVDAIVPDDGVIATYERLQADIEALQNRVATAKDRQDGRVTDLQSRVDKWTAEVEGLVAQVRENFESGFACIVEQGYHCGGSVKMDKHACLARSQHPGGGAAVSTLASCGVVISVRFRANQALQRLDAHVQSGGERSLTTFLYLLALNKVSKVPFRIVDEINQGMDEGKERISMQHLFATSGDRRTGGQYFLITPKLLTGLAYPETATIHVVFNGPGALPQPKMSFPGFMRSRHKRCLSDRTNEDADAAFANSGKAAEKRRRASISLVA